MFEIQYWLAGAVELPGQIGWFFVLVGAISCVALLEHKKAGATKKHISKPKPIIAMKEDKQQNLAAAEEAAA